MKQSSYLAWKNWDQSLFSHLSSANSAYYSAELRRASLLRPRRRLNVLEVGFGNGEFLRYASSQGWKISGTELNPKLLTEARRNNFIVYGEDALQSLPPETLDLVVAFDVIEHIPPEHFEAFLLQIKNLLRPGGIFLARFPNADSPFGLEGQNGDPSHVNAFGVGKIRYFAAHLGMQIVYLGSSASPLMAGRIATSLRSIITRPVHLLLDSLVRLFFLPGSGVSFSSRNTTCILSKR